MEKDRIFLSQGHSTGLEIEYINDSIFKSNGINIVEFEQSVASFLGNKSYVAALNSGTAAIHLGLILLGIKRGDEVICQSMTFSASANPIMYLGAIPIFIDSEKITWNMCPIVLEQAIKDRISKGKKPKAIITVHLYGMPYNIGDIHTIAKKYNIPILEDSAEAFGSTFKGQKCGTFGDIGVISFNLNKIITTLGGGVLISKSKDIRDKAVFLATQARDNTPFYQHSEIGYNYKMTNIAAGIGRAQMKVLDNNISIRRQINQFYRDAFKDIECVYVHYESSKDYFSNHWLTAITIDSNKCNRKKAEDFRMALENENIESRHLWKPMHLQPVFNSFPYYGSNISEQLFQNGLCLPSGSGIYDDQKTRILKVIQQFFC